MQKHDEVARGGKLLGRMAIAVLLAVMVSGAARAKPLRYPLPPPGIDVVGRVQHVRARESDTLLDIGRRHGVGFREMRIANPQVDMWVPGAGTRITIPSRFVLPNAPREGLVLNVAEMRLYYYPESEEGDQPVVETFPVSIGRQSWSTPLGLTHITDKVKDGWWYPPESIVEEARANGEPLPEPTPPGPDNPMGRFKMRLNIPGYLIHSTNKPWGIGMRVSHGCIRMYPEDIKGLFPRVPVDTAVRIVDQPVKAGWAHGELMVETHPLLEEQRLGGKSVFAPAVEALDTALKARRDARVDHDRLEWVLMQANGIPRGVSRTTTASLPNHPDRVRTGG